MSGILITEADFKTDLIFQCQTQSPGKLVAIKVSKFFQLHVSKYRAASKNLP